MAKAKTVLKRGFFILVCFAVLCLLTVLIVNIVVCASSKARILTPDEIVANGQDFDCILVQLKDYSNAELMKRKNELSKT